ncbi:LHX2 [Cordylochernes scorpioides]|uniref:LHX2 n=1 Tax=Cordylochernes scorpioides TaxID=51811 RepID=A0ABY6KSH3_9ARAC|nr:LHX2 [Cordylochernes scorpioides]
MQRCRRCQKGIYANELVMRARDLVFHVHCFTCVLCQCALTQGDYFGLRDDLVYCRAHFSLESPSSGSETPPPPPVFAPTAGRKGRPRKRKPQDVDGLAPGQTLAIIRIGIPHCTLILKQNIAGKITDSNKSPTPQVNTSNKTKF